MLEGIKSNSEQEHFEKRKEDEGARIEKKSKQTNTTVSDLIGKMPNPAVFYFKLQESSSYSFFVVVGTGAHARTRSLAYVYILVFCSGRKRRSNLIWIFRCGKHFKCITNKNMAYGQIKDRAKCCNETQQHR